jgi:hypothetical protein
MTHPILPPKDQLKQWEDDWFNGRENVDVLLINAYTAGADAELDACLAEVSWFGNRGMASAIRDIRRPKLPSLKQQACDALDAYVYGNPDFGDKQNTYNAIRRALEALPDD